MTAAGTPEPENLVLKMIANRDLAPDQCHVRSAIVAARIAAARCPASKLSQMPSPGMAVQRVIPARSGYEHWTCHEVR
jgi:hypothetical protein